MSGPVAVYRAIMLELERQRLAVGLPMEKFSEYAGVPDRYFAKALHVDQPSGRQAQWGTLQTMIDALFPHGFDLTIKPRPGAVIDPENLKAKLLQLRATTDPKSQRQLMSDLGKKGGKRSGESRRKAATKRKAISEQRRYAAACRWSTPVITEITAQVRKK